MVEKRSSAENGSAPLSRSAENGFTPMPRFAEHGFTFVRRSAEHGFTFVRRSAEHGFTLIELMVALAVFSLAALALIRLEGQTIRTTATLGQTMVAQMVARNVAIEALTDTRPPVAGVSNGVEDNGGQSWNWTRDVSPLGDQGALRVAVDVSDSAGSSLGHMIVVRAPPRPEPVEERKP
jgi:general secretion pathway protein I